MLNPISTTTYKGVPETCRFQAAELGEIENMAKGLSESEILEYYMLAKEDVTEADMVWFKRAYTRGRTKGKIAATDHLFKAMADPKMGAQAALTYLKKFAADFEGADDLNKTQAMQFEVHLGS